MIPKRQHAEAGFVNHHAGSGDKGVGGSTEEAIEAIEEDTERSTMALLVLGLEQERSQSGAQRERIKGGDQHRDSDGDGELLIEAARDARNSGRGDEYRGKNESDRNHGSADLFHGFDGGVARRHPFVDVMLDRFDHDDGVVDDETDGQHQAEERKSVDGESEHWEQNEGADERDGHGQQRNQGGAPALQEDIDDQNDQQQRNAERDHNLVDTCRDSFGGIERNAVVNAFGEGGREFLHALADRGGGCNRIGARQLVNGQHAGWGVVIASGQVIDLSAQFHARHVTQVQDGAIGIGANDDIAELFGCDQPALRSDRIGELLA